MWNHLPWLVLISVFLTSSSTAADGQIRLTGSGSTLCSGRVEIYHNDNWGTVCDDSWDLNNARVVCRQVGCGTALKAPQSAHFGQGTGQIWLDDVACSGSERSLTQCGHNGFESHNCGHHEDAGVVCSHVRLVGLNRCAGRTEIRYSSTWGTVCDDEWDMEDAKVVCAELDCGTALKAPHSAHFGQGSGQIWLDDVSCSGSERSLIDCGHRGFGTHNCEHSEDAGVVCSDGQKPSISMNPSGEVTWGQTVTITCSASGDQLNGTFIFTKTSGSFSQRLTSNSSSATLNIPQVDFENEGSFQCRFQRLSNQDFSTPLSDSVRLSVTVPLQQPNISLTSPNGGLVWGHKGAEITKGYSFVITCIISTLHSNGVFSLIFDTNITHSKPAVNNSAVFSFPVAEYEHQGNYSCIYEVTLSSRKFSLGETSPISITITCPLMLLIMSLVSGTVPLVLLVLVVVWLVHRKRQAKQPGANIQTQRAVGRIYGGCEDEEEQQVYMNLEPVCNTERQKKKGRQMEEKRSAHHKGRIIEGSNGQEMVYEECFAANKEVKNETSSDTEGDYIDLNEPSSEDYLDIYVEGEDNNEQEAVYEDTTAINETIGNQTRNVKDYRLNYGKVQQSLPEGDLDIYGEEEDIYENF